MSTRRQQINEAFDQSTEFKAIVIPPSSTLILPRGRYEKINPLTLTYITPQGALDWTIPAGAPFSLINPTAISNTSTTTPAQLKFTDYYSDTGVPLYRIFEPSAGQFNVRLEFAGRWFLRTYVPGLSETRAWSGAGPLHATILAGAGEETFVSADAYL